MTLESAPYFEETATVIAPHEPPVFDDRNETISPRGLGIDET